MDESGGKGAARGCEVTERKVQKGVATLLFVQYANTHLDFNRFHIFGSEQIIGNFCQVDFNAIPGSRKYEWDTCNIHHSFLLSSEGSENYLPPNIFVISHLKIVNEYEYCQLLIAKIK